MKTYRWTCNACDAGNDSNTTSCKQCGCPDNASGEDIEKYKDPDGFHKQNTKREAKDTYFKSLMSLIVWIPMATAFCLFRGGIESIAILLFVGVFLVITNIEVFLHISANTWARATLLAFFSLQFILFSIRLTLIDDNSDAVYWMVFIMLIVWITQYVYFFKSKRGRNLFADYIEKGNQ